LCEAWTATPDRSIDSQSIIGFNLQIIAQLGCSEVNLSGYTHYFHAAQHEPPTGSIA
jgi:hypothetical protein